MNNKYNSFVIVDTKIDNDALKALERLKVDYVLNPANNNLYSAVSSHPDMVITKITNSKVVYEPSLSTKILEKLKAHNVTCIKGNVLVKDKYPYDIPYNIAVVGKTAFHNSQYTDEIVKQQLFLEGIELVHVKQGYTKCSTCVISDNALISSDKMICQKAQLYGIDALNIPPQKDIILNGLDYGFIGGCSGKLNENTIIFNGTLDSIKDKENIIKFLKKHNKKYVCLTNNTLSDIGTILSFY